MELEKLVTTLQKPSQMRLMMGELDANELLVAQSAIRYALTQLSRHGLEITEKTHDTDYH